MPGSKWFVERELAAALVEIKGWKQAQADRYAKRAIGHPIMNEDIDLVDEWLEKRNGRRLLEPPAT